MYIVLVTRDRPELTRQTAETMKKNAADWSKHELVIVFDDDQKATFGPNYPGWADCPIVSGGKQLGVGGAKNIGALWFKCQGMPPNSILMFSDNDMYYLPDWDKRLTDGILDPLAGSNNQLIQLGGWKHPYHVGSHLDGMGYTNEQRLAVDAVTGNCFVIRWADWLQYGPFVENALGPGQSEDFAFSQKIKVGGGLIATLDPPVAIHCGLINCQGEPATGWVEMSHMAEHQIREAGIESIWIATPDEGTVLLEPITSAPLPREAAKDFLGLNVGSGQRRFDTKYGWINIDKVSRAGQVPDLLCDATKLTTVFEPNSVDMVVLHHVLEHFGCGEADDVVKQCYQVLKPGGSLLIFVPDMQKLAARWLGGEIDDFIFMANTYGAYQGEEGDRHRWGFSAKSMGEYLYTLLDGLEGRRPVCEETPEDCICPGIHSKYFDWRDIPGTDIAKDWWILGVEVIK